MRKLILVGGGGHCKSVIEAAESAGIEIAGIIDMPELIGTKTSGYDVIGCDDDIARFATDDYEFAVTIGALHDFSIRERLLAAIRKVNGKEATIVASTAYVSPRADIGPGTVILHHATVNANASIGRGCIINTAANVEHDCLIGDNTHISTGAMVNGGATIGDRVMIGSGAIVRNGIGIVDDVTVGAGAVVTRNITKPGTYVGVPATRIEPAKTPFPKKC